ncbi:hypothetical protein LWI29_020422 [Acer saccharum]|uniref:S-locus receptor kinase C-terminal domain-containing protein n=1 Tax=Acer saccharum TaxID=4024 RepID=A0AA39W385_ACESA|nr:hypothetical protein LWI29_020422 [Acer saccharum]
MAIVSCFSNPNYSPMWQLRNSWLHSKHLINQMHFVITHTFREGNMVADILANESLKVSDYVWWDNPPSCIVKQLRLDSWGVPAFRTKEGPKMKIVVIVTATAAVAGVLTCLQLATTLTKVGQILAWKLWKEGRPLELTDPFLGESCNESEAKRCIHISLLCLEHQPDDRPSMSSMVLMLGSDNALPDLKQPGFLMDRKPQLEPDSSNKPGFSSSNEITISLLEAH